MQRDIYALDLPAIIVGSAGSGKTVLTLEKLKLQIGGILYVTHSNYLVQNSRNLYYANNYFNEEQNIDFLSFQELLETIKVPNSQEVTVTQVNQWLSKIHSNKYAKEPNKLFEEFKGVITGSQINNPYLSLEEYCHLGVKQSIYSVEERPDVYNLFTKYLDFYMKTTCMIPIWLAYS